MLPCQTPAMSKPRWHVDSLILWMQIKKGDQKSYQNTADIWQLLVSGSLFISAPGILKINGFCTDAICCQDWCFSPWNKVLLVSQAAVYTYRFCFSFPLFSLCISVAIFILLCYPSAFPFSTGRESVAAKSTFQSLWFCLPITGSFS